MHIDNLTDKLSEYVLAVLAPKAKSWSAKFALGAASESMRGRIRPFVGTTGAMAADGDVDMAELQRVVKAGFEAAGHVDLLGGMLGFDPQDAEDLFAWLGR